MFKLKFFILIMLITCGSNAYGAKYYVDQTGGNDNNNGSIGSPWKNCPGMAAFSGSSSLNAGDIVYFDGDDTWFISSAKNDAGIHLVGGVTYIGDTWEADGDSTGKRAKIVMGRTVESGIVRFRDHSVYETVLKGFNLDGAGYVMYGVDINHRYWSLMNGATKRVENCIVHDVSSNMGGGKYRYGIAIGNDGGTNGYCENVEIIDNLVYNIGREGIALYPTDTGANNRIKTITVRGNEVYNVGQESGYNYGHCILVKGYVVDAYIEFNYLHNPDSAGSCMFINGNETRHYGVGPDNIHIRYNVMTDNTANGTIRFYDEGDDPKNVDIYGNILYGNRITGGISTAGNHGTLDLLVYNNTLYNTFINLTSGTAYGSVEVVNNVISYSGNSIIGAGYIDVNKNNLTSGISFSNTSNLPTGFSGIYGVDMAPNNDGLSLQADSPGIDAGIALNSSYNISINSISRPNGAGWDIGAYELEINGGSDIYPPDPPSNFRTVE